MTDKTTRRNFLLTSAAVAGGVVGSAAIKQNLTNSADSSTPNKAKAATSRSMNFSSGKMPERVLGATKIKVPIFGLGGAGDRKSVV